MGSLVNSKFQLREQGKRWTWGESLLCFTVQANETGSSPNLPGGAESTTVPTQGARQGSRRHTKQEPWSLRVRQMCRECSGHPTLIPAEDCLPRSRLEAHARKRSNYSLPPCPLCSYNQGPVGVTILTLRCNHLA